MNQNTKQNGFVNFTIKVNSKEVDKNLPIFSVTVNKTINKIPYAKILMHDGDPAQQAFVISNSSLFEIGKPIEIQVGYKTDLQLVFKGVITKQALKASGDITPYMEIVCKDETYRTTLVPKTISFANMKDSDVFKKILDTYTYLQKSISATTIKHETISQQDTTDWDFINLRAEANGQVVIVDDGKMTIQKPNSTQSPKNTFIYGTDIYELDVEIDAATQWPQTGGKIWMPENQKSQDVNGDNVSERSFGALGYDKLTGTNKQSKMVFSHGGTVTEDEMKSFSTSLLELNRLTKVRGKLTVQGMAKLKPGTTIKIDKGAKNFQGTAYVSGVNHRVEAGEWVTDLTIGLPSGRYLRKYTDIAGLPATGMVCPVYGLQIGIVKKLVEDPKSNYRIFVYIPIIHKEGEGVWCRIASFYASKSFGAFIMPEPEDEVVVGFINDDFRSPVVVGSLYNSKNAPPITQTKKNAIKTLVTKSKLELTFNEDDKSIVLKTPGGRTISISDKESSIEIVNGNANKIILGKQDVEIISSQNIVLNAKKGISLQATQNIDLKATNEVNLSGMNVSAKANMKASLVGTTSAEVQSGANTVIKGAIVQIN